MLTKKSVSIMAAMLALGVAGPAAAVAHDGSGDTGSATVTAPVTSPGEVDNDTADEQQSGEQGDVENADLAMDVEEVDGANDGTNDENEVGDGADGQVDDGAAGD